MLGGPGPRCSSAGKTRTAACLPPAHSPLAAAGDKSREASRGHCLHGSQSVTLLIASC